MAFYWTAKGNFYAKLWTSPAQTVNGTTDSRGSVTTVCLSAGLILQTRTMCARNGRREMKRQQTYKGLIGKGWYDQSEFSHRYACWANHRNNWAIRKADNRKLAKARLKQIERQQIRKELDEYDSRGENQEAKI
jgi:hypothetical protein